MAVSAGSPSVGGPTTAQPPADESVRVLLSVSRSLALVFALIAGLLFLLLLALTVVDAVLGRGIGYLVVAVYCLASAAVDFVIWREVPRLEQLASQRQYTALREPLLVWAILGLIFFVVVGVLLLVAWLRAEMLSTARTT